MSAALLLSPAVAAACEKWQYETMYVADSCPVKQEDLPDSKTGDNNDVSRTQYNGHPDFSPDIGEAPAAPDPAPDVDGDVDGGENEGQ